MGKPNKSRVAIGFAVLGGLAFIGATLANGVDGKLWRDYKPLGRIQPVNILDENLDGRISLHELSDNLHYHGWKAFSAYIRQFLFLRQDRDGDGLLAYDEAYNYRTSDVVADMDRDGLADMEEIRAGTLPHNPDSDSDGLADGLEQRLGTSPKNAFSNESSGAQDLYWATHQQIKWSYPPKTVLYYEHVQRDIQVSQCEIKSAKMRIDYQDAHNWTMKVVNQPRIGNQVVFKLDDTLLFQIPDDIKKGTGSFTLDIKKLLTSGTHHLKIGNYLKGSIQITIEIETSPTKPFVLGGYYGISKP